MVSRAARLFVVASLSASALVVGACSLLIKDYPLNVEENDASIDASTDATTGDAPPTGPGVCQNVLPPSPNGAAPVGDKVTYILALNSFTLAADPVRGFDLDGICSCDKRDHSKRDGGSACQLPNKAAPTQCDLDGGVDNSLGQQIARVSSNTFTQSLEQGNLRIRCGGGTVVLAINGYNGLADDDDIILTMLSSPGLFDPHDAGGDPTMDTAALYVDAGPDAAPFNCGQWNQDASPYPARFDGTDYWSSPPNTTITPGGRKVPAAPTLNGYVSNYTVVLDFSRVSNMAVALTISNQIPLTFNSPVMTAKIVPLDSQNNPTDAGPPTMTSLRLENGLLSGRCDTHEMLSAFGPIPVGFGQPACNDPVQWPLAVAGICSAADLPDDPSNDFAVPPNPCSAISVAFGFTAFPVEIGQDHDPIALVDASACPDSSTFCPTF